MKFKRLLQNTLAALLITLAISASYAQPFNVSITNPVSFEVQQKVVKYGNNYISFERYGDKLHTSFKFRISQEKFKMKLKQYDGAMNLLKETELAGGGKAYGPFDAVLRFINNKLYLLYFEMGNSEDSPIKLMAGEIDTLTTSFATTKELMKIENKEASFLKAADVLSDYRLLIKTSIDRTKTLLAWTSGTSPDYFYAVIDANLTPIWSRKGVTQPDDETELISCCFDAQDNVYLGLRSYARKQNYSAYVIVGRQTEKDLSVTLTPAEGRIYETHVVYNETLKQVQLLGTYKTDDYERRLLGMFSGVLNTNFKASKLEQSLFPEDLLQQLKLNGWANTKEKNRGTGYIGLAAGQLENGTIDLVGEFRRTESTERAAYKISGDIIVARFQNGNFRFSRIPKIRVSAGNTIGDSYGAFISGNTTTVFYNDKESNLAKPITGDVDRSDVYKNVVMVAATLSESMLVKREKVIDLKDDNYLAITDLITMSSPGTFFVPLQKVKSLGGTANESRWVTIRR